MNKLANNLLIEFYKTKSIVSRLSKETKDKITSQELELLALDIERLIDFAKKEVE